MKDGRPKAVLYATLYCIMVPTARENGYALALHGSLNRDMDLVAIPWTPQAVSAEDLIQKFVEAHALDIDKTPVDQEKPHGRKAWTLGWDAGLWLDVSVMPRAEG